MVRFCDKEIDCVEYDSLSRSEMLDYFLPDHKDGMLYVCDNLDSLEYIGAVTYDSLQRSVNVDGAINEDCVVLHTDMWQNIRNYFERLPKVYTANNLLPCLDEEYRLVCFAYEDTDADREIRMLRELQETSGALQFQDIYPECKCVKIYGFNELAFFFALYLENQNIAVEVHGSMWKSFFNESECQVTDYECMTIYAEGCTERKQNWKENLLRSVSVEFECIDKIYEANIRSGIIKNTRGGRKSYLRV